MNTYQEIIDWMFNQLPMYQNQGATAYKKDLTNTLLLADYLDNPEKQITCIHVAGTNGKGSTSHMLASVLQEAGYKVGLYTSPHLKDYRERIKINGVEISEEFIIDFIKKHHEFLEENQLSFFEMTVGLALDYFKEKQTNINIIEVGMGGRLDSTNIVQPLISVITNIGLDHTQFLGNTYAEIAFEKGGIIKNNIPVVIGEYLPETKIVFDSISTQKNAPIFYASDLIDNDYPCALTGDYQKFNKKTVLQTIQILQSLGHFKINESDIKNGFINVIKNTGLQGRWQILQNHPTVICDTAHNTHGLKMVMDQLARQKFNTLHLVIGVVNDKDLEEILPLFPKKANYYFCKPNIPRGLDAVILKNKSEKFNLTGNIYNSVTEAYQSALKNTTENDLIYVGGSTFVVAEIL